MLPFGGKRFCQDPRMVKLFGRKYEWVTVDKIFIGIFWSKLLLPGFLHFSLACLTESRSFEYGLKDLCPCTSFLSKLSRTVKTDDVASGTRDVVKQGRLWAVQG